MLASCGDVELEAGNLSAEGALVTGLAACVACCWVAASGSGYFLGLPLPLFEAAGSVGFGVQVDDAATDPFTCPVIHDFMCFLPSA